MSSAKLAESATVQTQPGIQAAQIIEHKGIVTLSAAGSGSGSWSATFSFAPVLEPIGAVGAVDTLTITNAAPVASKAFSTGCKRWIGWISAVTGTVTAIGGVEGA